MLKIKNNTVETEGTPVEVSIELLFLIDAVIQIHSELIGRERAVILVESLITNAFKQDIYDEISKGVQITSMDIPQGMTHEEFMKLLGGANNEEI